MTKRSANELWQLYLRGEVVEVHEESDPSWRHGEYRTTVVKDADGRYWSGIYCVSGDGETNEWRDGDAENFVEVVPFEKTVIDYKIKE